MKWLEVAVKVPPEGVELVGSIFDELGTGGVLIEDPTLIASFKNAPKDTQVVYMSPSVQNNLPVVKGYLPVDKYLSGRLDRLKLALERLNLIPKPQINTSELPETNWATAWQTYYKPIWVGKQFIVKPSWEDTLPNEERIVIELDPGMAFGSGTHETTILCMELLEDYLKVRETVIDVGTGSGILAIAAAKLGASVVKSVDNDSVAVKVAKENAALNKLDNFIEVYEGDLLQVINGQADLVVANIIADVIINLTKDVTRVLVPGGKFITSGIIKERERDVHKVLEEHGFTVLEAKREGEWVALISILEE